MLGSSIIDKFVLIPQVPKVFLLWSKHDTIYLFIIIIGIIFMNFKVQSMILCHEYSE